MNQTTTLPPPVPAPAPRRTPGGAGSPTVVAHRGASGHRPEHTLEAYRTAIRMGADAVELDLVPTVDGALIVRHESELSRTTDIGARPDLAHLRRTRPLGAAPRSGWFSEDLTLAQVRTLTARERMPELRPGNTVHDGREGVPTLDEALATIHAEGVRAGRRVGVLLELKEPARFAARGLAVEGPLLAALARHGLDDADAPVAVLSFEEMVLRRLALRTRVPLVRLLDVGDDAGAAALEEIASYAGGVGVHQDLVVPRARSGRARPSVLVRDAHRRGLGVHAWTLRAENRFLAREHRRGPHPGGLGDVAGAAGALLAAGVDGLITDHPDLVLPAVRARA
ncbi:glycerophosphodiester phosphodiesterase family protein [Nocardioides ochotonae]|uniref:glycerophosphodiester phosphodiesterase family protein n=1 Tax=Nocardioides ochotonae TaxID=2685869 RepID=UPI0014077241|nr:glycerophosphodiester phosphodiesterase family protein [Nocardioides ochotonae]